MLYASSTVFFHIKRCRRRAVLKLTRQELYARNFMIDTNRTVGYKLPLYSTGFYYMLILSLAKFHARYIKTDQP